jgi:hypothetical protein
MIYNSFNKESFLCQAGEVGLYPVTVKTQSGENLELRVSVKIRAVFISCYYIILSETYDICSLEFEGSNFLAWTANKHEIIYICHMKIALLYF